MGNFCQPLSFSMGKGSKSPRKNKQMGKKCVPTGLMASKGKKKGGLMGEK